MTPPPVARAKRSWPLLTLAATSFIPGFGFFLGAAAVTWGLLSDRPRAKLAVVIGMVGAMLQLAGTALVMWTMHDNPVMRKAMVTTAARDLARLAVELDAYHTRTGYYPGSLQELVGYPIPTRMININDVSAGLFRQQPYQYHLSSNRQTYTLFAAGPDGAPGTSDDIYPNLPDTTPSPPDP
jgi:hypothetical protein